MTETRQLALPAHPPIRLGDELEVVHDGGARRTGTFSGFNQARTVAFIKFGIAGDRQVALKSTATRRRGRFIDSGMQAWFVDAGTLERLDHAEERP